MPGFDPYSTPPRLTFDPLPPFSRRADERPGLSTPPIRLPGAVPFRWEEAPGRPRQKPTRHNADADKQLDLPPRLSASTKRGAKIASPTAVLDGPYLFIRRPRSFTFGKGKKVRWSSVGSEKSSEDAANSSASSLTSCKSFSSAASVCSSHSHGGGGGSESEAEESMHEERKLVRILRYHKRKRSVTCVASYSPSHLWAAMYGRLKQAVVSHVRDPNV